METRSSKRMPGGRGHPQPQDNVSQSPVPARSSAADMPPVSSNDEQVELSGQDREHEVIYDTIVVGRPRLILQTDDPTRLERSSSGTKRKLPDELPVINESFPETDPIRTPKRTASSTFIRDAESRASDLSLPANQSPRQLQEERNKIDDLFLRGGHMVSINDFEGAVTSSLRDRPVNLKPQRTEVELHATAKAKDYDLQRSVSDVIQKNTEMVRSSEALRMNSETAARVALLQERLHVPRVEQSKDVATLKGQLATLASDASRFSMSAALETQEEISKTLGGVSTGVLRAALLKKEDELTALRLEKANWHKEGNSLDKLPAGTMRQLSVMEQQIAEAEARAEEAEEAAQVSDLRAVEARTYTGRLKLSCIVTMLALKHSTGVRQRLETDLQSSQAELKNLQADLKKSQAVLQSFQTNLNTSQAALKTLQAAMQSSQTALQSSQADLKTSQAAMQSSQTALQSSQADLKKSQAALQIGQADLRMSQAETQMLRTENSALTEQLRSLQHELETLRKRSGDTTQSSKEGLEAPTLELREEVALLMQPASEIPDSIFKRLKLPLDRVRTRPLQATSESAHWRFRNPSVSGEQTPTDYASVTREMLLTFCSRDVTPDRVLSIWRNWELVAMDEARRGRMLSILFNCAFRILSNESNCQAANWLVVEFCCRLCDHFEQSSQGPNLEQFGMGKELSAKISHWYAASSPIARVRDLTKHSPSPSGDELVVCKCIQNDKTMEVCMALDLKGQHVTVVYEEVARYYSLIHMPFAKLYGGRRRFRTWIQLPDSESDSLVPWELDATGDGRFQKWVSRLKNV